MEWHVVPTGGQYMNGQAERLIGEVKKVQKNARLMNSRRSSTNQQWWGTASPLG